MRTLTSWLFLFATVIFVSCASVTGCKATAQKTAYKVAATTPVSVETAVRLYNAYAAAGKTTVAQNAQVKALYVKYQASFAVLCDAGSVYAASATTNSVSAAIFQQAALNSAASIQDILNLITSFGVKL